MSVELILIKRVLKDCKNLGAWTSSLLLLQQIATNFMVSYSSVG